MECVYMLLPNRAEWDEITIIITEEEAINQSIAFPRSRVEIFRKNNEGNSYVPTYSYYKKGELIKGTK